jgi:hypothetical protein
MSWRQKTIIKVDTAIGFCQPTVIGNPDHCHYLPSCSFSISDRGFGPDSECLLVCHSV